MAGVPCVGSQVDAIPELIPSPCGMTVPAGDVEALAHALSTVILRLPEFSAARHDDDLPSCSANRAQHVALFRRLTADSRTVATSNTRNEERL
jgi:glycosyltransferase involved in cell wall biosynthesis